MDETLSEARLLGDKEIFSATRRCVEAWNSLDLEAVLATYSDDVVYQDPGSGGRIIGKENLRRYLRRFLEIWDMQFDVTEDRRISGDNAQVCLWNVTVRRRGDSNSAVATSGMDIIHVNTSGELSRDEAFIDRAPLLALNRS
ncbi:nuclear transport factor 2 family protein [Nocardia nova]|uniref:nuclear transport factor 2 family protein n=1 Tax=Nocardia nova TaxID=37330 RepID=UPI001893AD60|nr:nuclear transport factor 2 family protein [Nocardia nova]MBF6149487.1 nuclear transport factor 2 family protein [Nocardia nova]